jgi:hypothetical protein
MHILEQYAINSGAQIRKPFIFDVFFPLPFQKYISFSPENNNRQKYKFWQEVIEIINPILEKEGIKVLQLNGEKLNNCFSIPREVDYRSKAYLIKNSIIYFGVDGFHADVASFYGKKIVTVYGDFPPENKRPYWSEDLNIVNIYLQEHTKPTYNLIESDAINEIKPEEIAFKILDLINLQPPAKIKTEYIGDSYINKTFEIIPDGFFITPQQISNLIIRMDYLFNEESLASFLSTKRSIIITNKNINVDLLLKHRNNIIQIIYEIDEQNDPTFVMNIKSLGIKYEIISYLPEDILNKFKLNYLDLGLIHRKQTNKISEDLIGKDNLWFKSSRVLASSKGLFSTKYHWQKNIPINNPPLFLKDISSREYENLYIYSIDK